MTWDEAQYSLPLTGSALPLPRSASLWIVAAENNDTRYIREHLLAATRDERGAFFVRETDGTLPFGPDCVVGIHDDRRLHLFAPPKLASPELPRLVAKAFSSGIPQPTNAEFEDLLLVRLWGNGVPTNDGSQADRPLGLGLSRLQTSDMHINPFIFRSICGHLLGQLGDNASPELRAMLRRAWAASVLTATRNAGDAADAGIATAWEGLTTAAGEFERAGLMRLAERCASDAELVGEFVRAFDGSEPFLPGLTPEKFKPSPLRRTAFRSFRCIGIRVPQPDASPFNTLPTPSSRANLLVAAGSVSLRELRLGAILGSASYPGLLPRVRRLPARASCDKGRVRVWLDEEHKALLDLPLANAATPGNRSYVVSVKARGRLLEPPFRSIRQGRPTDFFSGSGKLPKKVVVRVSAGGYSDSFEVAVG